MSLDFYNKLPIISEFTQMADLSFYQDLPDDWIIIVTDVIDSTKAVAAGKYKDVNTIGAATISCVQAKLKTLGFPFVFGGDGATLVLPTNLYEEVKSDLVALMKISQDKFGLSMRVGAISNKELLDKGIKTKVSRYQINPKQAIAVFSGGGLKLADKIIKDEYDKYQLTASQDTNSDLSNLSCRWNPIPSKFGKILTLLIESKSQDENYYNEILTNLDQILEGQVLNRGPMNLDKMTYKGFFQLLFEESRLSLSLDRLKSIFFSIVLFKWGKYKDYPNVENYRKQMGLHSDYKKFDDMIRLVLDCGPEQVNKIEKYLKDEYQKGHLIYGTHLSNTALMTCLVETIEDGDHIHFIDGGDGGYTAASIQLKEQALLRE